jgi:hypothetical protein
VVVHAVAVALTVGSYVAADVNSATCQFLAFFSVYFELACFSWSAVIAYNIYSMVVEHKRLGKW